MSVQSFQTALCLLCSRGSTRQCRWTRPVATPRGGCSQYAPRSATRAATSAGAGARGLTAAAGCLPGRPPRSGARAPPPPTSRRTPPPTCARRPTRPAPHRLTNSRPRSITITMTSQMTSRLYPVVLFSPAQNQLLMVLTCPVPLVVVLTVQWTAVVVHPSQSPVLYPRTIPQSLRDKLSERTEESFDCLWEKTTSEFFQGRS